MKLETMTKIAATALYASVLSILSALIFGAVGRMVVMAVLMGFGAINLFIFDSMSDRIDKWYEKHDNEKS